MTPDPRALLPWIGATLCGCILHIPLGDVKADRATEGSGATGAATDPPVTTGEGDAGVTDSGELQGESQTMSGSEASTAGTTGDWLRPPAIFEVDLMPDTLMVNGPVQVLVSAEYADGVQMKLDSGEVSELTPLMGGVFSGSFDVLTGLLNGEHSVHLTPWRDAVTGEVVMAPYTIALPAPGSQLFWETSDELGPGQVVALGVLPDGQVVEFGTHFPNGVPRCYLRRRDKNGVSNDIAFVLEDSDCSAVDLKVDDQGQLSVLVNRTGGDGVRWWYGRSAVWGKGVAPIGEGIKGETAVALALSSSGAVAVCGYAPTPSLDVDAMVKIFEPNNVASAQAFDYQPVGKPAHSLDERPRDCVFSGDTLALVGEVYGLHESEKVKRDRLFILRADNAGKSAAWTVSKPGVKTQSGAQAVDVDGEGRLVVAGYSCDDACLPEGDLRIYDSGDILEWQVSIGAFTSKDLAAEDVTWSPAGYIVVATGGLKGAENAFTVRAFAESKVAPLWSFTHKDIQALDLARALAIGRYGEVYAGGIGVDSYPAVAHIGG